MYDIDNPPTPDPIVTGSEAEIRIWLAIDEIKQSQARIDALLSTILSKVDSYGEQIKPTIDALMKSPILKMMGVK